MLFLPWLKKYAHLFQDKIDESIEIEKRNARAIAWLINGCKYKTIMEKVEELIIENKLIEIAKDFERN